MILTNDELQAVYESIVQPFGHPDPVGYITRALIESEGDPEYYGADGRIGFLPVDPAVALEMTGSNNVSSLQGNVTTTLLMDQMYFQKYGTINDMITAFHFGEEMINETSKEITDFISEVDEGRPDVLEIVSPRKATVKDVMEILSESLKRPTTTKVVNEFIEAVLQEQ